MQGKKKTRSGHLSPIPLLESELLPNTPDRSGGNLKCSHSARLTQVGSLASFGVSITNAGPSMNTDLQGVLVGSLRSRECAPGLIPARMLLHAVLVWERLGAPMGIVHTGPPSPLTTVASSGIPGAPWGSVTCRRTYSTLWKLSVLMLTGFPGGASVKEPACQCRSYRRPGFDPWVGKIPWRRAWQPIPVFLPGESLGQRNLAGYSPCSHKESDVTEVT